MCTPGLWLDVIRLLTWRQLPGKEATLCRAKPSIAGLSAGVLPIDSARLEKL
jgi:hypothetical protein